MLGGGKDLESEEDGWQVVRNKKKRCKSSNFVTVSSCAPSGSLFNGVFLTSPQSKVDQESDDLVPQSKSDPGPVSRCGSFVSPGSGSVSDANAQTDLLMSEMKRDPAFALAVSSLERCLKVRERVGSSLILGRSGKPSGSENESKGPVSDSHGTVHDSFSCAVAPVEADLRSGAVGASGERFVSDSKGKVCVSSGAGFVSDFKGKVCVSSGTGASSTTASSSGVTVSAHVGTVKDEGINVFLEDPEPVLSESIDEFTAAEVDVGLGGRVKSTAAHATAGERTGIFGSFHLSESDFPPLNSSRLGSLSSACARRVARSAASARVCPGYSSLAVSAAVARVHASTLHDACFNSWSDTGRVAGSHGHKEGQRWGFRSGRRFASCLRGGGRGKFSAGRRCTGAGCRFTSQEATRHRNQATQGGCGHTFPPPGGSWYPIRVTWTRIGHQAINGLDEGV